MKYAATMNTPGYLPWDDDEPPVFDTAAEAWMYLADERRRQEDDVDYSWADSAYSETVGELEEAAAACKANPVAATGVIYGYSPGITGSDGMNDLGIAYCVTEVDE